MTAFRFDPLIPLSYELGVIDCPWLYNLRSAAGEKKSPQAHYECMPDEAIVAMDIGGLFTRHALTLWWCTAPMIERQIAVIKASGFRIVTMGVWLKTTKAGHINMGTGYRLRGSFEPFLVACFGKPPQGALDIKSAFASPLRRHSEKPDEIFDIAERMHPRAIRRLDLFSRTDRPGWTSWGDEAGKFGAAG